MYSRSFKLLGVILLICTCFGNPAHTQPSSAYYPFVDDMENPGSGNWLADVPWGLITNDYHSVTRSWTDSPGSYYANNANVALSTSFSSDLTGATHPVLRFWHHYDLEPGYDFGYVEVSTNGGISWITVGQYSGTEVNPVQASLRGKPKTNPEIGREEYGLLSESLYQDWVMEQIDLTGYAGSPALQVRFRLDTDATVARDGWYIDDVALAEKPASVALSPISNATSSSLELSWSESTDTSFSRYEIYRGYDASVDIGDDLVATVEDSTVTTYVNTGLAPKTTYYYRVYVVSDDGIYAESNVESGTTLPGLDYPFADDMEGGPKWYSSVPNTWRLVTPDQAHSGNKIWTDSPGGNYGNNWNTAMELAGTLPLTQTSTLIFWHRIDIAAGDSAFVEYSSDNGATWHAKAYFTDATISSWTCVQVDLSEAQSDAAIRFRIQTDGSGVAGGWDIDDVSVSDAPLPVVLDSPVQSPSFGKLEPTWSPTGSVFFSEYLVYRSSTPPVTTSSTLVFATSSPLETSFIDSLVIPGQTYYYRVYEVSSYNVYVGSNTATGVPNGAGFPFSDAMETGDGNWVADSLWGRTTDQAHSGTHSWTDSPSLPYTSTADVSLTLNLSLLPAVHPYLSFWERHMFGSESHGLVEVSVDGGNWTTLADFTADGGVWKERRIDLSSYRGQANFWLRFRLWANGTAGEGWYIDDVTIAENATADLAFPFYEGADDVDWAMVRWMPGSWGIGGPGYEGVGTWMVTARSYGAGGADADLNLAGAINLAGALTPQLVFWHRGSGLSSSAHVDIQLEGGAWTQVWSVDSVPSSWTQEQVDLTLYANSRLRIRFRAAACCGGSGTWYVDEISVVNAPTEVVVEPPSSVGKHRMRLSWSQSNDYRFIRYELRRDIEPSVSTHDVLVTSINDVWTTYATDSSLALNTTYFYKVYVVSKQGSAVIMSFGSNEVSAKTLKGFAYQTTDDMEGGTDNWDLGSPWGLTDAEAHSATHSLTDSPGGPYDQNSNSSLGTMLSLSGATQPYLGFWERHMFGSESHGLVEVSVDGSTWTTLADFVGNSAEWKERRIDLSSYRGEENFWLRFRSWANGTAGEGWYIDDVTIGENATGDVAYPFYESADDAGWAMVRWMPASWGIVEPGYEGAGAWMVTAHSYGAGGAEADLSLAGAIDLAGALTPQLVFWHRGDESNANAYVDLRLEGGEWTQVWSADSMPSSWTREQVDLSMYANSKVRIRFRVEACCGGYGTWYVDEIGVAEPSSVAGISIRPSVMYFDLHPGWLGTDTLVITNTGTQALSFVIQEAQTVAASLASAGATGTGPGERLASQRPGGSEADKALLGSLMDLSWLSISPAAGSVPVGDSLEVYVDCSSSGGLGTYTAYLVVSSNDPEKDLMVIPVHRTVSSIYLLNPLPGDSLSRNESQDIAWSLSESVISVDLILSTDAGRRFNQVIVSNYTGPSPYHCVIPALPSDSCVLQIRGITASLDTIGDFSNGFFTIYGSVPTGTENGGSKALQALSLTNFPNPFNPMTTVHYVIRERARVRIDIFDVSGTRIRTLVDAMQEPTSGGYDVAWDGKDDAGVVQPSGVYLCRIVAGAHVKSHKMVLVR